MDTTVQLPEDMLPITDHPWPSEILVEPARLASGLWGFPEGDINAAYCADTFPKIRTFVHEGRLFTNCGGSCDSMNCYPLIPTEQYTGPESMPYSYQGKTVAYKGRRYRLGPKVAFTVRERSLAEETDLLRRQYAYGGGFATGKTYRRMLLDFLDRSKIADKLGNAICAELARPGLPETQEEMLAQLNNQSPSKVAQPSLPGF